MNYVSLFSGIEAATVAWHPLGWKAQAFSEVEAFPRAVLAHHWPSVALHGDMTAVDWSKYRGTDIVVGGSPCQAFSVAGLRKGLADARGNLTLAYLVAVEQMRPAWVVWENVPGVLSIDGGRVFGAFLGGLGQLGYGFAYRVLDAQHFGVPQRRRRVFVVGYLGDWRRAAAVLFEPHSLSGNPPPRREAGEGVAPTISARPTGGGGLGTDFDCDGGLIHCPPIVPQAMSSKWAKGSSGPSGDECANLVTHALTGEGFDASEDGTGRGTPVIPFDTTQISCPDNYSNPQPGDPCHPLARGAHAPAIAASIVSNGDAHSGFRDERGLVPAHLGVRRLTPRECERLQGFPDDYTLIPGAKDGPRYKALGNSMAVPVMRWIGERIALVGDL